MVNWHEIGKYPRDPKTTPTPRLSYRDFERNEEAILEASDASISNGVFRMVEGDEDKIGREIAFDTHRLRVWRAEYEDVARIERGTRVKIRAVDHWALRGEHIFEVVEWYHVDNKDKENG